MKKKHPEKCIFLKHKKCNPRECNYAGKKYCGVNKK